MRHTAEWLLTTSLILAVVLSACGGREINNNRCSELMKNDPTIMCLAILGKINEIVGEVSRTGDGTEIIVESRQLNPDGALAEPRMLGHGAVYSGKFNFDLIGPINPNDVVTAYRGTQLCVTDTVEQIEEENFMLTLRCVPMFPDVPSDFDSMDT